MSIRALEWTAANTVVAATAPAHARMGSPARRVRLPRIDVSTRSQLAVARTAAATRVFASAQTISVDWRASAPPICARTRSMGCAE
eukprot:SAG31_NODE_27666_length_422_cov_0.907121_1_plen_85_part_01